MFGALCQVCLFQREVVLQAAAVPVAFLHRAGTASAVTMHTNISAAHIVLAGTACDGC